MSVDFCLRKLFPVPLTVWEILSAPSWQSDPSSAHLHWSTTMKRSYFLSFSFPLTRVGHFPSRLEVEQRGETLDLILLCQGLLSGGINLAQFDVAAKFNLLERTSFLPRKACEIQLGSGGNSRGRMEDSFQWVRYFGHSHTRKNGFFCFLHYWMG